MVPHKLSGSVHQAEQTYHALQDAESRGNGGEGQVNLRALCLPLKCFVNLKQPKNTLFLWDFVLIFGTPIRNLLVFLNPKAGKFTCLLKTQRLAFSRKCTQFINDCYQVELLTWKHFVNCPYIISPLFFSIYNQTLRNL